MDSTGASQLYMSIETLLEEIKSEISFGEKSLKKENVDDIVERIESLEKAYKLLLVKSKNPLAEFINIQKDLEESKADLVSQIENTTDLIWSVDRKLQIKTINTNFAKSYQTAFGVKLKEGVSVIVSLPDPLGSVWTERYKRALNGEQFSITDRFDIENIPRFSETSFNPIRVGNDIVGVACFSRDITEQKESEEQFKLLAKLSPNPISIISTEGYLYVNTAWEKVFGYTAEEALSKPIDIIIPDSEKKETIKSIQEFILSSSGNNRHTYRLVTKSKEYIWLDVASTPLKFNNKKAILSVSTDISELLKLQEELKKSQANLLSQLDNTDARIWSIDAEMRIVHTNANFKADYKIAFNIDLSEGVSALEGVPNELADIWRLRYKKALDGEKYTIIEEFDIENIAQFVEVSFNPVRVEKKVVGVSCYSRDISLQKNAELALKESEQRYKTLVDNIPSVTYRCALDKDWTIYFISEEVENLTGYPAEDFINNKVRSFSSIIHLDDKDLIEKAVQIGVRNKKSYRIEYRIVNKNGTIKWVHERGRAMFNDSGEVLWLDGVISDITSRKQSEASLRESEEQYRAIFNSMSDVFIRTDMQGNILIVTPSIIDFLGFTPEEVVGKPISELYEDPDDRKKLLAQLSEKGFVREFETKLKTREGEEKVASINAKLLVNDEGKPYGIEGITRDITLRKMAQRALEERTQELDSIFENAPIILILIDSDGNVLNVNKAGTSTSKHEKPEILNQLAGDAINCVNTIRTNKTCGKGEQCKNCIIRNTISKTLETKQNQNQIEGSLVIYKNEQEIERKFLISTTYIDFKNKGRILISLDDITDMRLAEEEITRLSAAVDQSTATIVITDIKGRIEYVNPQFEKSTGYKMYEAIGKNPRILKSLNTPPETYAALWETILAGETWQGEFLNVKKDGTQYWESAIISPITNKKGRITHFIAIKDDITERKKIQQELINSEQELREINEEKSRYLSILAHDLRGLVGSFHAYTDLILTHFDEFTESEFKEQLGNLTKVSGDSLNLLDNLLAWGKTTQGQIVLNMESFDLNSETDNVISMLKEIANKKQIELINNIPPKTLLTSDINAYQTIVRNLINNAIKFTPKQGSITVMAEKQNNIIQVSVTDTGVGMDDKTVNKLFKLGEKVVREGTAHEQGTGLGLIICKEMVKKLGGTINVESEPGKGSRFYFKLPI